MLKQYDPQTARETILRRVPLDETTVSETMLAGIEKLFGEALTPEQAVLSLMERALKPEIL